MIPITITRPVADPFQFLSEDHAKAALFLSLLEETGEQAAKKREELFAELDEALMMHTEIEETLFYPIVEKIEATKDLTNEAYEEHNIVKALLTELDAIDKDTEEWTAKLTVLKENVSHHVKEEESELFPKAKVEIPAEDQTALAGQIEDFLTKHGK